MKKKRNKSKRNGYPNPSRVLQSIEVPEEKPQIPKSNPDLPDVETEGISRAEPLTLWETAGAVKGSVILKRKVPQEMAILHLDVDLLDLEEIRKAGKKPKPCPLCGDSMDEDRLASVAFTFQQNHIICRPCSSALLAEGISHKITYRKNDN